jgi:hypothetical protein
VVEDEFLLAMELETELADAGAIVLGPEGTIEGASALIGSEPNIDSAILDMNLGGSKVFPAADLLAERGIPCIFTTGYDASVVPARFTGIRLYIKPIDLPSLVEEIARTVQTG